MAPSDRAERPRHFAVCDLLIVVAVCAVDFSVWRLFGDEAFVVSSFAMIAAIPRIALRRPWKQALLLSSSAVYGPFVGVATYTLVGVDCSPSTMWSLLPVAPGLVLIDFIRNWMRLPTSWGLVFYLVALLVSVCLVTVLTWLVRSKNNSLRIAVIAGGFAYGAFAALVVLAMIRM
jgi:hypothetical protein